MKKNTKVFLGSSMIIVSVLLLLFIATPASSGAEVTIGDLNQTPEEYAERYITTEGLLVAGSEEWNADHIELRFEIEGDDGETIPVFHHGVKPDNFEEEVIIIVHGYLTEDGVFVAEKVQTRCPSQYEGIDPSEYDPEFHRQLDVDLPSE